MCAHIHECYWGTRSWSSLRMWTAANWAHSTCSLLMTVCWNAQRGSILFGKFVPFHTKTAAVSARSMSTAEQRSTQPTIRPPCGCVLSDSLLIMGKIVCSPLQRSRESLAYSWLFSCPGTCRRSTHRLTSGRAAVTGPQFCFHNYC